MRSKRTVFIMKKKLIVTKYVSNLNKLVGMGRDNIWQISIHRCGFRSFGRGPERDYREVLE